MGKKILPSITAEFNNIQVQKIDLKEGLAVRLGAPYSWPIYYDELRETVCIGEFNNLNNTFLYRVCKNTFIELNDSMIKSLWIKDVKVSKRLT